MRTWTTPEERTYDTTEPDIHVKVEIADSNGTLRDWCDLDGNGVCIVESISWGDNIDSPMAQGQAVIDWQRTEHEGLSPFVSGGRYEGYLGEWREIVISTKVVPPLADASGFSWREVFRGRIDNYDLSKWPGEINFREKIGAELMDQELLYNKRYGDSSEAATKDVEDVIGDLLTDHDKTSKTLYTPTASSFQVREYTQTKMRLLQAIRNLAFTLGWDVRSKWHDGDSEFKLTLYEPDRATTTVEHTIQHGHIEVWNEFGSTVENIRNAVRVWYGEGDSTDDDGNSLRSNVVRTAATSPAHDLTGTATPGSSIAEYGWRKMEIAEASSSIIQDATAAQNLADYAIDDLATPTLIARCVLGTYFWPVEINDYYEITADGVRLGADTECAVFGYSHSIEPGGGAQTELVLRAKPGLGPMAYFARAGTVAVQPDDLAPDVPTVNIKQTPLGVLAEVDTTNIRDFDRVLFYVGPRSDFTPGPSNLVQNSRSTSYAHLVATGIRREWLKVKLRDLVGNISEPAGPYPLVAKKTDGLQLSRPLQAKTSVGWYSDYTMTGYGVVKPTKYVAGEALGDYNLETGRFVARQGGTYRVSMSGRASTTMTEGTHFYMSLFRDPDGDDEEVGRAIFQTGASGNVHAFNFEEFVVLDEDDEIQFEVWDPGSTWSNLTLQNAYTTILIELVGTQTRTKPYPFVEADPVFLDHGPSGNYSSVAGECHAVFRMQNGEIAFCNGAAGAAHPIRLHRNEIDVNKARSITVSGSTDYWFGAIAEGEDRSLYVCTNKVDATANYSVKKYDNELALDWTATSLGATIESRCVAHVGSTVTNDPVYVGTAEPSSVGKVRAYNSSTGAHIGTATATLATVNSLVHINPKEDSGGYVVAMCSDATAPDIVALDASDVTAAEIWRIQLDALATAGTSDDQCELKTSPDFSVLYAVGGTTNPTVYAISSTGDIIWSEDLGDHSQLTDITGCLSVDVHPTTGDVAVLCYYDNTTDGTKDLDCVVFDPDGNYRWSWRELGELDPADDPDWTSSTTGHRIAFATDGAIWVSGGGSAAAKAKIIKPWSEIPNYPPGFPASALVADFDAEALDLMDGAAVTDWPANRDRRSKTLTDGLWRLENDTAGEQPTFRGKWKTATVDSVARVQTEFAAVEFDGTERLIGNLETTVLADGAICVLVCEPVDTTGDYFSGYADAGSAANPLVELVNDTSRLTFNVNMDGSQNTYWDHASRAGLQVVACRGASLTEAGIWLNNAKPNQTAAQGGTDATPDGNPRVRLGQAGNSSGDWFAGWVYRWIWVKPSVASAARVASIVHWARAYYGIAELAVEVPAGPGDTITLSSGPTQFFTGSGNEVTNMDARNLTGQCLIGRRLGSSSVPHVKAIDDAGGTDWSLDNSDISSTLQGGIGGFYIYEDGLHAVVSLDGSDGVTYGSSGHIMAIRVDMSDGTHTHKATATSTSGGAANTFYTTQGVDGDETNDRVVFTCAATGGHEIKQFTMSTITEQAVSATDFNNGSDNKQADQCLTPDKGYLISLGAGASYAELARFTMALSTTNTTFDGYSTGNLTLDGTDTTNDFGACQTSTYAGRVIPARDGSNKVYFCMGTRSGDAPYVGRMDPDSGTYGAVDAEVDACGDANFTPSAGNYVLDIAVDQYGYVYCLCVNGAASSTGTVIDIVRYDADLTNPFSFTSDGGVSMPSIATYGGPTRIAVDENDTVYLGSRDGYVTCYTQT